MKVEIKSLKSLQTHDGIAYTCTLHLNGKKAANVEHEGRGGSVMVWWNEHGKALEAEWKAYVQSHPSVLAVNEELGTESDERTHHCNEEIVLGALADEVENRKWLKRHLRTKVLFRLPEDDVAAWRTVKHGGNVERARKWLVEKHGSEVVFAEVTT